MRLTWIHFCLDEKEAEENKENLDVCKDKEGGPGKRRAEHELSEGNVATAAAAALASAATKAKVCQGQILHRLWFPEPLRGMALQWPHCCPRFSFPSSACPPSASAV